MIWTAVGITAVAVLIGIIVSVHLHKKKVFKFNRVSPEFLEPKEGPVQL